MAIADTKDTVLQKRGGKKPSAKMVKAASLLATNPSISKRQALVQAGYSEHTARKPHEIVESPTFKAILDKYIPEEDLGMKHKQLLEASDTFSREFDNEMPDEDIALLCQPHEVVKIYRDIISAKNPLPHALAYVRAIDRKTAKEALDMGYKLRGSYAPVKTESKVLDLTSLLEAALGRDTD